MRPAISSIPMVVGRLGLDEDATKAFAVGLKLLGETIAKLSALPVPFGLAKLLTFSGLLQC